MAAPFRIRRAARADLPAVAALEAAVFPDPWSASAFRPYLDDPFLVAEADDATLLGYVVTRVTVDEGEILNVAVREERRRGGVGRALVRAALAALDGAGAGRVHLEVRASNVAARRLYESEGFRLVGRRRRYYRNPPEDALLLARNTPSASKGSRWRIFD